MKCSVVCCSGLTFTGIYFIATISYGSLEMSKNCAPAGVAQKNFDAAAKDAQVATDSYNTAVNNWQAANTRLNDARCVENGLPRFTSQAAEYCNYNTLDQYQINVGVIADKGPLRKIVRIWDNIVQLEADCNFGYDYTQPFCSDNCITWSCARYCDIEDLKCYKYTQTNNVDICIETRSSYTRRSCWFDRAIDSYDYYGIIASGSSGINLACGQYSHAMSARADATITADTTTNDIVQAGRIVQQKHEVYHGSTLKFDSKVPQPNTATQLVPTSSQNTQALSNALLQFIQQQCKTAQNNIQTPSYYSQIVNSTLAQLPQLLNATDSAKQNMQAAIETMNGKKYALEQASEVCNQSLGTWLPTILVPSFILCCFLSYYESQQNKNNFENSNTLDTQESNCGLTSICISKPLIFSRPTQPTVTQDPPQTADGNNVMYAEEVYNDNPYEPGTYTKMSNTMVID